jgi:hypothetical protein
LPNENSPFYTDRFIFVICSFPYLYIPKDKKKLNREKQERKRGKYVRRPQSKRRCWGLCQKSPKATEQGQGEGMLYISQYNAQHDLHMPLNLTLEEKHKGSSH